MLAPDICNFKLKHTHNTFSKCVLNGDQLDDIMAKHSFNHCVCAVFPDTLNLPADLNECFSSDTEYYKVSNLPVSEFVDNVFIEAFVKRGELTALSIDTLLDIDDCAAVTPKGFLVLSLNNDTFLKLGVDKGPSVALIRQKAANKIQLHINLKNTCFKPGRKNYDRIQNQLKKMNHLSMNFVFSWEPDSANVCPSSIAAYFHKRGYLVEECYLSKASRVDYNVKIPPKGADPEELFEWFGLHALGAREHPDPVHHEFLSTYPGMDMDNVGQVVYVQWTGLFTTRKLEKLLNKLRKYITDRQSIPFIGLHVQGFDDAPVSWDNKANRYLTYSDNSYSYILFPTGNVNIMKTFV
ncbi:ribonuclease P protein subunit p40-like isoform X1 [Rhodnius prolixus]|uniref:ribonuclease P protein subunit p40-like isoform X1 n=1 Tax=Rhodnius prolixus TaxID=13249 RepID=UPI003D18AC3F